MDIEYWEDYYEKHNKPFEPSPFAQFVMDKYLTIGDSLVDIGCGNGRDSIYFANNGVFTMAVDQSETAIDSLDELHHVNLVPMVDDFVEPNNKYMVNHVYSRFTLHSIDGASENKVLDWVSGVIHNGYFFIEVRSDHDALVGVETDHYRRFINFENLLMKLIMSGFNIEYAELSRGFSEYKGEFGVDGAEDDPMLIRVVARK